jgi:drug/metabolite transporter (DMT)-like permease
VRTLQLHPVAVIVIGYVAIFPSIISYLCYNRGVAEIGANRAGLFIHLMPVFGSVMAIVFLGERLFWHHLVGIALIAIGIVMAVRKRQAGLNSGDIHT